MAKAPKIESRSYSRLNPWVELVEVTVRTGPAAEPAIYHGLRQADYVSAVAMLEDGRMAIVRQFRPMVGHFTWELPSGLLEGGERPEDAMARELSEEAALEAIELLPISNTYADTGRMTNRALGFFALCRIAGNKTEIGLEPSYVTGKMLKSKILANEIALPNQIALLYCAAINPSVRRVCSLLGFQQVPWL